MEKTKRMNKKNKKADIPVMVLVIGVIALFGIALLSFYLSGERQIEGGIKSVFYLQDAYNTAESARYSMKNLGGSPDWYEGVEPDEAGGYVINKEYASDGEIIMKVTYNFAS